MDKVNKIFDEALLEMKEGRKTRSILIVGRPGCGKSAVIDSWVQHHKSDINPMYLLANTRCREYTFIQGSDGSKTQLDRPIYFSSDELDSYNNRDSLIIIDHFDLTYQSARNHLLDLVENSIAVGDTDGNEMVLDNRGIIIATAYPDSHLGYDALSEEDKSVFDVVIELEI